MSAVPVAATGRIRWLDALGPRPVVFVACFVVWTLSNADQSLFTYVMPGLLRDFQLPLEAGGIVLTIAFLFAPLPIVLAGMAADRYGRGTVMWLLLALSALCVGLQGAATGIVTLTIFRSLGFGLSGGLSPITNAMVIGNASPRLRGVAMGILQCGYPVGWFLASLVAAPLLRDHSWRFACYAAFGVIPLAFLIAWIVRRAAPDTGASKAAAANPAPVAVRPVAAEGEAARASALRRLLGPELRLRTLASCGMFFTFGGAYAGSAFFFTTYFVQAKHYSDSVAVSIVGISNFVAILGYLSAALVGEFLLTRRNVFVIWCLGGAFALCGLLWWSSGMFEDIAWYSLMAILFFGTQAVVATFIGDVFPADIRTTALAFCGSAPLTLGFAVFPSIVPAVIAAVGWPLGLTLVVVPLLLASALIALTLPNVRSGLVFE